MWAIDRRLFLGNYWSGEQALTGVAAPPQPSGEAAPFSAVVSLCPMPLGAEPLPGPIHASLRWLHLPISDGGMGDGEFAAALELCLPFVAEGREQGNVLVHCAAGMSRSVSVVAAVLCSEDPDLSVESAFQRIAHLKAHAVGASPRDVELLVAPAWEFRNHLRRRFSEPRRRANGRSSTMPAPRK